jgi:hypothetical protein
MMRPELSATTIIAASRHHLHLAGGFELQGEMHRHFFFGYLVFATRGASR